jgi:hypothetical protein
MVVPLPRNLPPAFVHQPLKFGRLDEHPFPDPDSADFPFPDVLPDRPMTQTNGIRSLPDANQKLLHTIPFSFPFPLTSGCQPR